MQANLKELAAVMKPMSEARARELCRRELRATCSECGNAYYPDERPRDCLVDQSPNPAPPE